MENEKEQLEALHDIRQMMKDSSRFLSLSGLSGVFAGVYALIGAYGGYLAISSFRESDLSAGAYTQLITQIVILCFAVLVLCIGTVFYFSSKKAKKHHLRLFDHTSKKLIWTMALPLLSGGIFCLALLSHGDGFLLMVSPAMLLFYGLALVSSSRFTLHDIGYLGYLQILLGIAAAFFPGHGLLFWALGFGVLHIVYGALMWFKYDRD